VSLRRFVTRHKMGLIATLLAIWTLALGVVVADRWFDLGLFPTYMERRARRAIAAFERPEPERSQAMRLMGREIDAFAAVPELIRALDSSSRARRTGALACLRRIARVEHGYQPDAPHAERLAAIARWKAWWTANHYAF